MFKLKLNLATGIMIISSILMLSLLATRISTINHHIHYNYMADKIKYIDKKVKNKDFRKPMVIYPIAKNNAISIPKKPDKTTHNIISPKDRIIFLRRRKNFFKAYRKIKPYDKIVLHNGSSV